MKKTIMICALAAALSGCCAFESDRTAQPQYAYAQPAPQQAGFTYRSYVQASYTQPVRQQQATYYQQPVMQRPVNNPDCGCHYGCPMRNCGC